MRWTSNTGLTLAMAFTAASALAAQDQQDPPSRVGRLSVINGSVSLYPSGAQDWSAASLNYPLTSGDAVWSDAGARAELQFGASALRLAAQTSLTFGEVSDSVTQFRLDQGSVDVHVGYLGDNEIYEVDTPSGVISLMEQGHYRIDVTPDGRRATITVRDGSAAIERDNGDPYQVRARTSVTLAGNDARPIGGQVVAVDDWERWADSRAQRDENPQSNAYVSADMVGAEDLSDYGTWQAEATYGNVWYPRTVSASWAPYRYGRWESVGPWGWTWIDDAPWGFAPFHYGRWAYIRGRWGWAPGSVQARPVYAPALVAFVGGSGWGASLSAGGAVGWVPLAPGEAYVPNYRASPRYISRVNPIGYGGLRSAPNRNVSDVRYANSNAPGAFTAVPRDVFTRSRPVPGAALNVRPTDVASARPAPPPTVQRNGPPERTPGRGNDGRGDGRGNDNGRGQVAARPPQPANAPNNAGRQGNARPGTPATAPVPPRSPWQGRPRPGNAQMDPGRAGNAPVVRRGDNTPGTAGTPVNPPNTPPVQPPVNTSQPTPPAGRPVPRPSGPPGRQTDPVPQPAQVPPQPQQQAPQPVQPAPVPQPTRPDRPGRRPDQPQQQAPVVQPPPNQPPPQQQPNRPDRPARRPDQPQQQVPQTVPQPTRPVDPPQPQQNPRPTQRPAEPQPVQPTPKPANPAPPPAPQPKPRGRPQPVVKPAPVEPPPPAPVVKPVGGPV